MPGRIFYRVKSQDRDETTELIVVAVQEVDLTIYQKHLYLNELKALSELAGAELVELPRPPRREHGLYHGEEDIAASSAI